MTRSSRTIRTFCTTFLLVAGGCANGGDETAGAGVVHDSAVAHDTASAPADTGPTTLPADTGSSLPSDDTGSSLPPDDTGSSLPPGDSGSDAVACGTTPTLHPPKAGATPDTYCPFSATTTGGKNIYCSQGKQCCETPSSAGTPSTCVTAGAACPVAGSTAIQCTYPQGCGSGKRCCANAAKIDLKPGCTYDSAVTFTGTVCATSCSATQFVVCAADTDCPSGQTCTPFAAGGSDYGVCQ